MEKPALRTCPEWLNKAYRRAVKHFCQLCGDHEQVVGKLEIHRVKRGNMGGLYTVCKLSDKNNNVKVVCNECHKLLHSHEFM